MKKTRSVKQVANNKSKILLLSVIVIIVSVIICILKQAGNNRGPERPANVPVSSIWKGGLDGGNWYEFVEMKEDTIRIRIFNDWNGSLILDADFVPESRSNIHPTEQDWKESINCFDGNSINCRFQNNNVYYKLVPVFPAYYQACR